MSKVIHLSDDAHQKAKVFCKEHSLKMSDWVATLIREAIAKGRTDIKVRTLVPKKKILERLEAKTQAQQHAQPVEHAQHAQHAQPVEHAQHAQHAQPVEHAQPAQLVQPVQQLQQAIEDETPAYAQPPFWAK